MKTLILISCLLVTCGVYFVAAAAEPAAAKAPFKHAVAFKFKETTTPEQIKQVEKAFGALKTQIPQIASLEWGTNVSPEKFDKGFTHGFILAFKDTQDRDTYLKHPDHKQFAELAGPLLADIFVIDFQAHQ